MQFSETDKKYLIAAGAFGLLLFVMNKASKAAILDAAAKFIASNEGFRSRPYWDVSRYSWGYGTKAPGATGTITPAQALAELRAYATGSLSYLSAMLPVKLSVNQWAALLDFAYNEGNGAAAKLVPDITSGNFDALAAHFRQYVYAGGVYNSNLDARREREIDLWQS